MKQSIIIALIIASSVSAMEKKSGHTPPRKPYNNLAAQMLERQSLFRQFLFLNAYGDYQSMQKVAAQLGQYNYPTSSSHSSPEHPISHYRLSLMPLIFAFLVILIAGGAQVYSWF